MTDVRTAAVVVLAAGAGTRMRSSVPKVLHPLCGRSMLGHTLTAAAALTPAHTLVVVGHGREQVTPHLAQQWPAARPVVQDHQGGTGHAARLALDALDALDAPAAAAAAQGGAAGDGTTDEETVVVLPGDAPLLGGDTLRRLVAHHATDRAAVTLLTAEVPDPTGYGRVVRDSSGRVTAVVEDPDATEDQRWIGEVATSVYAFDVSLVRAALARLGTDNSQGEEYLPDAVALLAQEGHRVGAVVADDWRSTLGVNDRVQLAAAGAHLRDRLVRRAMLSGATVTDPATTWLDVDVVCEPDSTLAPNTRLHGTTRVGAHAVVGPDCTLTDTVVGAGARVRGATCEGAEIGPEATVGPYSYLRPGTRLGRGAKAGGFVETKAADIGDEAKVPHLSYVGDAAVGPGSNIGAGTVFVNYDGREKHRTEVGAQARVGSDTMLVAPVTIGDGAYTAAGSVVTEDVPAGALAVARARQRTVDGWVRRRRAGTPAADAAEAAEAADAADSADSADAADSADSADAVPAAESGADGGERVRRQRSDEQGASS